MLRVGLLLGICRLLFWVYCGLGCGFRLIVLLYLILLNLNKIGGGNLVDLVV